ncbi:unnamed protein product [Schistosoma mattheei]|uniref:Uncharacterized protein n=1 Tax=Schistosoma mattheei TaxID=31246 RepID=A0A183Q3M5_9TREM|nr:unnamed protein product [Schistosoma mattheei]
MSVVYSRPVFKTNEVQQIYSQSVTSETLFHMRLSGDPVVSSSRFSCVNVALNARADAALIDWLLVGSRLYAVRLESSIKSK